MSMFKRYAVITTSAKILGRVLSTDIDIANIRDYFIDYHTHTVSERSLADKAIDVIFQFSFKPIYFLVKPLNNFIFTIYKIFSY